MSSAGAETSLRGPKIHTRSVTSRNRKKPVKLAASDDENVPLMSAKTAHAETSSGNPETGGENSSDVEDRDAYDSSEAESSQGEDESRLPEKPRRNPVDQISKNGKTGKPARSADKSVKKKRQNKPRRKFPCKVCGKPYTKFYMDAHMQLHSGEKPFCCQEPECKRQFATEYYLRMHVQRCHGKSRCYPCEVCDRKLASKRGLIEHMRIHSEERPFICQVCGKGFRQPALLFNHIKTHDDLLPFQCEQCGIRYKYKRSMERHKEKIHDGISHSFPCKLCERVFSTKSKLKEHQYFHEGNSPHVCEVCGKRLLARKTLQNHMLIHQGEKPYRCEVCGKLFRFVIVLKRHLSVHTGVKPFRCNKCGRQFIHRVYMDRHKCATKSEAVQVDPVEVGDCVTVPLEPLADVIDVESVEISQAMDHGEHIYTFVPQYDDLG